MGLLTGRKRAYGYFHMERVLTTIAKAGGADSLTTALGKWTASLWSSPSPVSSPCFYIDGHRKPVYADKLIPRGRDTETRAKCSVLAPLSSCMTSKGILSW